MLYIIAAAALPILFPLIIVSMSGGEGRYSGGFLPWGCAGLILCFVVMGLSEYGIVQ